MVGATGNVGTALLRRLGAEPSVTAVGGVSRRPAGNPPEPPYDAVEWLHTDLSTPDCLPALTRHLHDADAVVHLAWKIQPGRDEAELWRTNVDGARRVMEAVAAAGVPHLVVSSSVGVYSPGPKDVAVDEDWPRLGIPTSSYSRHKVVVEEMLDRFAATNPRTSVARVRPGLVFQADAGAEIARFFLGPLVPVGVLGRVRLPWLPLPAELVFQAVHADDLAAAVWAVLDAQADGPFNVADDPVLTPADLAGAVGADGTRPMPLRVLRGLAAASWRAHLQPTDPGWVDLAAHCPVMSTARIRSLGWTPTTTATQALSELVEAISGGRGGPGPALRPRGLIEGRTP